MWLPAIVWLGLIGATAIYEVLASRHGRLTLSEWVWAVRRKRRWFGWIVGALLIVLAVHLLWPTREPPPDPPAPPPAIVIDED